MKASRNPKPQTQPLNPQAPSANVRLFRSLFNFYLLPVLVVGLGSPLFPIFFATRVGRLLKLVLVDVVGY